uniref:Integral membrane protein n=1 Tax=Streptomyces sp. NBC_00093 TaxID=2975649 RepID=A0AAU1ZXF4_9ACTN
MLRHEFQPGKLIAGIFVTIAGITYIGDAGDAWETPWFAVIPLLVFGLTLAGAVALLTGAIRRRRKTRRAPTPPAGAPEAVAPSKPPEIPN